MKMKLFMLAMMVASSRLQAQNDSSKTLQAVIVTANKMEQKQAETGKVVTVISQDQLQNASGKMISEILHQQVGIFIGGSNNTLGTNQTVYIRGANAANTLILLDGVPLYDASGISSEFDLNSFALDQVERIEILKGAQSTLYGSDAVAGVINIISKKSTNKKLSLHGAFSAGSYQTYRGSVSISGNNHSGISYYAGYTKTSSNGFSAAYDSTINNNFDKDGFKQDALNLRIGFLAGKNLSVSVYGKYNINRAQIDAGAFTNDNDDRYETKNANIGTTLKYQEKRVTYTFNYNYNWYDRVYINDSTDIGGFNDYEKGKYNGRNHFAELFTNISVHKKMNVVAGIDFRNGSTSQSYLSKSMFGWYESRPMSRDTIHNNQLAAYASFIYNNHRGFTAGFGGRLNHHSVYGNNGTFSINPSYQLKKVKIFANISSGYRVPSLYQLYSEYGNTNLKPERSVNYEAGLQYNDKNLTLRAVGFKRDIKDIIIFYSDPLTFESKYLNEDKQKDFGLELEAALMLGNRIAVSANYAYVDGKLYTKDVSGKDSSLFNLYRRPKNICNLQIDYQLLKGLSFGIQLRIAGAIYEPKYAAEPVQLSDYYTLDLYAAYQTGKHLKFFTNFRNITDQKYFDQEGFNTRRFNVNAGILLNY